MLIAMPNVIARLGSRTRRQANEHLQEFGCCRSGGVNVAAELSSAGHITVGSRQHIQERPPRQTQTLALDLSPPPQPPERPSPTPPPPVPLAGVASLKYVRSLMKSPYYVGVICT
ncbi:hypothetical protein NL676_034386 [Syzygium grande]|nr:hypothetical protein NL676_034386 [Syzygium grande]